MPDPNPRWGNKRDSLLDRRGHRAEDSASSARNGNLTVGAFLADWLAREVPKFAKSVNTIENYRWPVEGHLVPSLGKRRLAKLTTDDVDRMLEAKVDDLRRWTHSLMAVKDALLLVIGAVLGLVATLTTSFVQEAWRRRWDRETDTQRRAAVRSEEAAKELLPILDEVRAVLEPHTASRFNDLEDEGTDDQALGELRKRIERLAVQVGDETVRARLESIAWAITSTTILAKWGHFPDEVGRRCRSAGRNALGHVLGGEDLELDSTIGEYRRVIEEDWAFHREAEAEYRRAREQPDESSPS